MINFDCTSKLIAHNSKLIALRHIPCEDLACFEPSLLRHCGAVRYVDMDRGAPALAELEQAAEAPLVISLGGPMAVYEADRYPFIRREIEILAERIRLGRPTLGICLGAQIMAAAAGARVYPGGRQEIGWYPIRFTQEAAADPVLGHLAQGDDVFFHWHGDTFDLPPGSRPLGASERFARQGFAIGSHAVALQFHAEVTASDLDRWLADYAPGLKAGPDVMDAASIREGARRHAPSLQRRGLAFLSAWLEVAAPTLRSECEL